jgi:hypothetical protein
MVEFQSAEVGEKIALVNLTTGLYMEFVQNLVGREFFRVAK